MFMTILLAPLMFYSVLYVALFLGAHLTNNDYRNVLNMTPDTSITITVITLSLCTVIIMAFVGGAFNLPVSGGWVANIASLSLYMAAIGAWYWLWECYQQRVYLNFFKR